MDISYLLLCSKFSQNVCVCVCVCVFVCVLSRVVQKNKYLFSSQFMRVGYLGEAQLGGSGSGSLLRLLSVSQLCL